MDMDVRKAVRTIEHTGFNGLSGEELERFINLACQTLEKLKCNFKVGDKVKKIEKIDANRPSIYYGYVKEIICCKFEQQHGRYFYIHGVIFIDWRFKYHRSSLSKYIVREKILLTDANITKENWTLENILEE